MSATRSWFKVQNATDDEASVEFLIYEPIGDWLDDYFGFGVTAKAFVEQLEALPESVKTIRIRVNSPGGDVFAAVAIANALRDQRSKGRLVEAYIDGLAASAASIIIMAADPIRIADNGMVFVHNPVAGAYGNADLLEQTAGDLRTIRSTIVATYRWHSKLSDEGLGALMDAETWLDADAAIAKGFATEKIEGFEQPKAAAQFSAKAMARLAVPAHLKARVAALIGAPAEPASPATVDQVFALCRRAGVSDFAETIISANATLEHAKALIAGETAARATAKERAREIAAICELSGAPQFAAGYVNSNISVAVVRSHMTNMTALLDNVEIDTSLDEGGLAGRPRKRNPINRAAIYDRMNGRVSEEARRG